MSVSASIRLEKQLRHRVGQIAKRERVSASDVIRRAIEAWVDQQEGFTPYEAVKDLIGVAHGGNPKRSADGGLQVKKLLKDRRSHS